MKGHGYGGSYPPDSFPHPPHQEQSMMMEGRYQDLPPHLQHHPSHDQHDSSPFHRRNSHYPPEERHNSHYPPARPPPFWSHVGAPPPDALPPPAYPPQGSSFYPPQPESFYPPPPQHHPAFYSPHHGPPHTSSFGEHVSPSAPQLQHGHTHPHTYFFEEHSHSSSEFVHASSFGQHGAGPPSVDAYAHQSLVPQHSSSFHPSVEASKPLILEREAVAETEISSFVKPPPTNIELPKGQLVRVFCKSSRSFNLAVKDNRVLMVKADTEDEFQQWIRDDKYSIRVRDSYGQPAFMLINKGSNTVLKHGHGKSKEVQLTYYTPGMQDDTLFWTESQDFGEGFKTVRLASDTLLNLSVASRGNNIENGSPLMLDTWHKKDNQLWKIFPL